jgi:hypothetical protein
MASSKPHPTGAQDVGKSRKVQAVTLPEVLAEMQCLLWCWSGYCPICDRALEGDPPMSDTG